MNQQTAYNALKNKVWILYHSVRDDWAKTTTMGDKGILTIAFEKNGNLSFPSTMGFLPNIRTWNFDEQNQTVVLNKENGAPDRILKLPVEDHVGRLFMYDSSKQTDWFECFNNINLDDLYSPVVIPSEHKKIIVWSEIIKSGTGLLVENASKALVSMKKIEAENLWQFLDTAYYYLITHSKLDFVGIVIKDINISANRLLETPKRLTVYKKSDSEIGIILGSRAELIELLAEILIFRNHIQLHSPSEVVSPRIVTEKVITQFFATRIIKGTKSKD